MVAERRREMLRRKRRDHAVDDKPTPTPRPMSVNMLRLRLDERRPARARRTASRPTARPASRARTRSRINWRIGSGAQPPNSVAMTSTTRIADSTALTPRSAASCRSARGSALPRGSARAAPGPSRRSDNCPARAPDLGVHRAGPDGRASDLANLGLRRGPHFRNVVVVMEVTLRRCYFQISHVQASYAVQWTKANVRGPSSTNSYRPRAGQIGAKDGWWSRGGSNP